MKRQKAYIDRENMLKSGKYFEYGGELLPGCRLASEN